MEYVKISAAKIKKFSRYQTQKKTRVAKSGQLMRKITPKESKERKRALKVRKSLKRSAAMKRVADKRGPISYKKAAIKRQKTMRRLGYNTEPEKETKVAKHKQAKPPEWFEEMSEKGQKEYLKEHPGSELAKKIKRGVIDTAIGYTGLGDIADFFGVGDRLANVFKASILTSIKGE